MTNSERLKSYKLELKIEKLKMLLDRFNNQANIMIQDIDRKNDLLKVINDNKIKNKIENEIEETKKQLEYIRLKMSRLEIVINRHELKRQIINVDDLLKNDEIVLINNLNSIEGKYNIYRLKDESKIGFISFLPENYDSEIGSVGYGIFSQYRGNNYAYKALCLLTNYLSNNGIKKISIVAEKDNISSINVMEKFKNDAVVEDQSNRKEIQKYSYTLNSKGNE